MDRYAWGKALASVFFPQRDCLACNDLAINEPLCPSCSIKMPELRKCPACATFIALTETEHYLCPACRHQAPAFVSAYAALPYQDRIRDILIAFKYHQQTGYRRQLADLLLTVYDRYYPNTHFDAILPVPLHANRLAERGYNQAELLSYIVAKERNLSHQPQLLQRIKETAPLYELKRSQRIAELKGSFIAMPEAKGKNILLLDDIFTTGATAEICSQMLLKNQANSVSYLSVAAGYTSA